MCILCVHAQAGYLQQYETLLKEMNAHPGSEEVPPDQYVVETVALSNWNKCGIVAAEVDDTHWHR